MKNIHILPTNKPSRLAKSTKSGLNAAKKGKGLYESGRFGITTFNIYITSDELIKDGYYLDLTHNMIMKSIFYNSSDKNCKKIILTTDKSLDGVQAIDDEFLEWFVKNPSCEEVKTQLKLPWESSKDEYEIIIPKEEPKQHVELINDNIEEFDKAIELFKQETLNEAAERLFPNEMEEYDIFLIGARWQQERSYSEEDMRKAIQETITLMRYKATEFREHENTIIEKFKKK